MEFSKFSWTEIPLTARDWQAYLARLTDMKGEIFLENRAKEILSSLLRQGIWPGRKAIRFELETGLSRGRFVVPGLVPTLRKRAYKCHEVQVTS